MRCFWRRKHVPKSDRAVLLDAIRTSIGDALNSSAVHPSDVADILEARATTIRVALSSAAFTQPRITTVG